MRTYTVFARAIRKWQRMYKNIVVIRQKHVMHGGWIHLQWPEKCLSNNRLTGNGGSVHAYCSLERWLARINLHRVAKAVTICRFSFSNGHTTISTGTAINTWLAHLLICRKCLPFAEFRFTEDHWIGQKHDNYLADNKNIWQMKKSHCCGYNRILDWYPRTICTGRNGMGDHST